MQRLDLLSAGLVPVQVRIITGAAVIRARLPALLITPQVRLISPVVPVFSSADLMFFSELSGHHAR